MNSNELNKIVILYSDDWSVLYVNGKEKKQGSNIDIEHISKFCPIESIKEEWVNSELEEKTLETGYFPSLDVILEIQPELKDLFG